MKNTDTTTYLKWQNKYIVNRLYSGKINCWRAGGGGVPYVYGFGYWTGEQKDLLCVKECKTNEEAEKYLSPLHRNKIIAFLMFLMNKFYSGGE